MRCTVCLCMHWKRCITVTVREWCRVGYTCCMGQDLSKYHLGKQTAVNVISSQAYRLLHYTVRRNPDCETVGVESKETVLMKKLWSWQAPLVLTKKRLEMHVSPACTVLHPGVMKVLIRTTITAIQLLNSADKILEICCAKTTWAYHISQ